MHQNFTYLQANDEQEQLEQQHQADHTQNGQKEPLTVMQQQQYQQSVVCSKDQDTLKEEDPYCQQKEENDNTSQSDQSYESLYAQNQEEARNISSGFTQEHMFDVTTNIQQ